MRRQVRTSPFWLTSMLIHLSVFLFLILLMETIKYPQLKEEELFVADFFNLIPPAAKGQTETKEDLDSKSESGIEEEKRVLPPLPLLPNLELPQDLQVSSMLTSNFSYRDFSLPSQAPPEREVLSSDLVLKSTEIKPGRLSTLPNQGRTLASKEPAKISDLDFDIKADGISDLRASAPKTPEGVGRTQKSPIGFSYLSGNVSSSSGSSIPQFRGLMSDLAKRISQSAKQKKVDVVFIVDTTASMMDNIRGVKAYISDFLAQLKKNGLDAALGLVKFGDLAESKIEVKGTTEDAKAFRNWLHHSSLDGGGDLAESGLDAIAAAFYDLKFRRKSQKFFIFISDGPFHDADFDGQSKYSLDQIIELMKKEEVQVDVVGIDYLPIKQVAWGTGGEWTQIPGSGFLEQKPVELPFKIYSQLGLKYSLKGDVFEDRIIVYLTAETQWVNLSWKVLDPIGQRFVSGNLENKYLKSDAKSDKIELEPKLDLNGLKTYPGTYTIIYRITDSLGNSSVLRRSVDFNQKNP